MKKANSRNSDTYEIIASNIKSYRKLANMTQAELADKTNYSYEFIRRIEAPSSKKYFSINTIVQISKALDISVEKLFEGINEKKDDK